MAAAKRANHNQGTVRAYATTWAVWTVSCLLVCSQMPDSFRHMTVCTPLCVVAS
jgi:hypothetical protein